MSSSWDSRTKNVLSSRTQSSMSFQLPTSTELCIYLRGIDTSAMDDTAVAMYNTGSRVFISSNVKFVDAMEDLNLVCNM